MERRIVVCANCGVLLDIHYVDAVEFRKKVPVRFVCPVCKEVPGVVYKELNK